MYITQVIWYLDVKNVSTFGGVHAKKRDILRYFEIEETKQVKQTKNVVKSWGKKKRIT